MGKKSKFSLFSLLKFDSLEDIAKVDLTDISFEFENRRAKLFSNKKRFLNTFTDNDMMEIIKKVGLLNYLIKQGLDKIIVVVDIDEDGMNYFKIFWKEVLPENILLDLRVSEKKFIPSSRYFENSDINIVYDMIFIEWMSAQNPLAEFSGDKPQLPGQVKPGLGILKYCFMIMEIVAKHTTRDGFLDIPDHFHGAVMYSRRFKFFDPAHEGVLRALLRDLKNYSLSDISWGMLTGTVIEQYSKKPQSFDPAEQIFYVSHRLREYFHSPKYKETYHKYYKRKRFYLDYEQMVFKRAAMLKNIEIRDL